MSARREVAGRRARQRPSWGARYSARAALEASPARPRSADGAGRPSPRPGRSVIYEAQGASPEVAIGKARKCGPRRPAKAHRRGPLPPRGQPRTRPAGGPRRHAPPVVGVTVIEGRERLRVRLLDQQLDHRRGVGILWLHTVLVPPGPPATQTQLSVRATPTGQETPVPPRSHHEGRRRHETPIVV